MKILLIGSSNRISEFEQLAAQQTGLEITHYTGQENLTSFTYIIDFDFDTHTNRLQLYAPLQNQTIIVSAVGIQLAQVAFDLGQDIQCTLFGFNAIPTFINRDRWEMTTLPNADTAQLNEMLDKLNLQTTWIADRIGMLTPRVIFMIINEAFYTLQEGTATVEDIDMAMKLGTNYPYGLFEWADRIGLDNIYSTLEAMYQDTHDERYKICPLLKTAYLQNRRFYN